MIGKLALLLQQRPRRTLPGLRCCLLSEIYPQDEGLKLCCDLIMLLYVLGGAALVIYFIYWLFKTLDEPPQDGGYR